MTIDMDPITIMLTVPAQEATPEQLDAVLSHFSQVLAGTAPQAPQRLADDDAVALGLADVAIKAAREAMAQREATPADAPQWWQKGGKGALHIRVSTTSACGRVDADTPGVVAITSTSPAGKPCQACLKAVHAPYHRAALGLDL